MTHLQNCSNRMNNHVFPDVPNKEEIGTTWAYNMRREMQEIIPGLYLGPYGVARKSNVETLQQCQITHIVCIRQTLEAAIVKPNFPHLFRYLVIDIADLVTENIILHFPKMKEFLDQCLSNGGKVLVHGNAGISRSAALVIAYIMEKFGLPYREAYLYVQQRRFCINPNEGFARQLVEYEPIYKARLTLENGQSSSTQKGNLKRKFSNDDDESEMDVNETL